MVVASLGDSVRGLALERCPVNASFTSDDKQCSSERLIEANGIEDETSSWCKFRSKEGESKAGSACCSSTRKVC